MGQDVSVPDPKLQAMWPFSFSIDGVRQIAARWKNPPLDFCFCLRKSDLTALLPDATEHFIDFLWRRFALSSSKRMEEIDALAVVSMYYVFCNARLDEKLKGLFQLFDFNANQSLSRDELVILFLAVSHGSIAFITHMTGGGLSTEAIQAECERMTDYFFRLPAPSTMNGTGSKGDAGVDDEKFIDLPTFQKFVLAELDADGDSSVGLDELILFFSQKISVLPNLRQLDELLGPPLGSHPTLRAAIDDVGPAAGLPGPGAADNLSSAFWKRKAVVPRRFRGRPSASGARATFDLEWVYGFSSYGRLQNVGVANVNMPHSSDPQKGLIVYPAGNVCIVYDPHRHEQVAILRGHQGNVRNITMSEDNTAVASSDTGRAASNCQQSTIIVWNLLTPSQNCSEFPGVVVRGADEKGCVVAMAWCSRHHAAPTECKETKSSANADTPNAGVPVRRTYLLSALLQADNPSISIFVVDFHSEGVENQPYAKVSLANSLQLPWTQFPGQTQFLGLTHFQDSIVVSGKRSFVTCCHVGSDTEHEILPVAHNFGSDMMDVLCTESVGSNAFVAGSSVGWLGLFVVNAVDGGAQRRGVHRHAHSLSITALHWQLSAASIAAAQSVNHRGLLYSAGAEGWIKVWRIVDVSRQSNGPEVGFEPFTSVNFPLCILSRLRPEDANCCTDPRVQSLKSSKQYEVVVGTVSGNIFGMPRSESQANLRSLVESPGAVGAVTVVVASPTEPGTMVTASTDGLVRVWDCTRHRVQRRKKFFTSFHCGCFSPDGKYVAFAHGKRVNGSIVGGFLHGQAGVSIVRLRDLHAVGTWPGTAGDGGKACGTVTCLKWSPDGVRVAAGCESGAIFMLDVSRTSPGWVGGGFSVAKSLHGHRNPVVNVDFDTTSSVLQSNCSSQQLRFWQVRSTAVPSSLEGEQTVAEIVDMALVGELKWATLSCAWTWRTRGLFSTTNAVSTPTVFQRHTNRRFALCAFHGSQDVFYVGMPQHDSRTTSGAVSLTIPTLCGGGLTASTICFNSNGSIVTIGVDRAGLISQWHVEKNASTEFSHARQTKPRRKVNRLTTAKGVFLGACVDVKASSSPARRSRDDIWLKARVTKVHGDGTVQVSFYEDAHRIFAASAGAPPALESADTVGIRNEVHVPLSRVRAALEFSPPQMQIPGDTVYPGVLRSLNIGHGFDKAAKMVITGSRHNEHNTVYAGVWDTLGFATPLRMTAKHWMGDIPTPVSQRNLFQQYRCKEHKIPLSRWLADVVGTEPDATNAGVSRHDDSDSDADSVETDQPSASVYLPCGMDIKKGSAFEGVYRASSAEWEVYVTKENALRPEGRDQFMGGADAQHIFGGSYASEVQAALAFDSIAFSLYGQFACLNFARPTGLRDDGEDTASETDSEQSDDVVMSNEEPWQQAHQREMRWKASIQAAKSDMWAKTVLTSSGSTVRNMNLSQLVSGGNGDSNTIDSNDTPCFPSSGVSAIALGHFAVAQIVGGSFNGAISGGQQQLIATQDDVYFPGGCAVILQSVSSRVKQRLFRGHQGGPVACISAPRAAHFVVSASAGEGGCQPTICVWDPTNLRVHDRLRLCHHGEQAESRTGKNDATVHAVDVSPDGIWLVVVYQLRKDELWSTIAVFKNLSTTQGRPRFELKCAPFPVGCAQILAVCINNDGSIYSAGKHHAAHWTLCGSTTPVQDTSVCAAQVYREFPFAGKGFCEVHRVMWSSLACVGSGNMRESDATNEVAQCLYHCNDGRGRSSFHVTYTTNYDSPGNIFCVVGHRIVAKFRAHDNGLVNVVPLKGQRAHGMSETSSTTVFCSWSGIELKLWCVQLSENLATGASSQPRCVGIVTSPDNTPLKTIALCPQHDTMTSVDVVLVTEQAVHHVPGVSSQCSETPCSPRRHAGETTRVASVLPTDIRAFDVHPSRPLCAIGTEQGTLHFFEASRSVQNDDRANQAEYSFSLAKVHRLDEKRASGNGRAPIRVMRFHPNGSHIVVLVGGHDEHGRELAMRPGRFVVLDVDSVNTVAEGKAAKKSCNSASFSPNGELLAIGSSDCVVYIHDTAKGYECIHRLRSGGHQFPVTSLDFSADAKYLRSAATGVLPTNDTAADIDASANSQVRMSQPLSASNAVAEIRFWKISTGKVINDGHTSLRDVHWATQTNVCDPSLSGVWPSSADELLQPQQVCVSEKHGMVAVLSKSRDFRVFQFPSNGFYDRPFTCCNYGHASTVAGVGWVSDNAGSPSGKVMCSIGQNDGCLLVWVSRPATHVPAINDMSADDMADTGVEGNTASIVPSGEPFSLYYPFHFGAVMAPLSEWYHRCGFHRARLSSAAFTSWWKPFARQLCLAFSGTFDIFEWFGVLDARVQLYLCMLEEQQLALKQTTVAALAKHKRPFKPPRLRNKLGKIFKADTPVQRIARSAFDRRYARETAAVTDHECSPAVAVTHHQQVVREDASQTVRSCDLRLLDVVGCSTQFQKQNTFAVLHDYKKNFHEIIGYFGTVCFVMVINDVQPKRFYEGHHQSVSCVATHPTRRIVASADIFVSPSVHVWDPDTLETLHIVTGVQEWSIECLCFCRSTELLVIAGGDARGRVAAVQWNTKTRADVYRAETSPAMWGHVGSKSVEESSTSPGLEFVVDQFRDIHVENARGAFYEWQSVADTRIQALDTIMVDVEDQRWLQIAWLCSTCAVLVRLDSPQRRTVFSSPTHHILTALCIVEGSHIVVGDVRGSVSLVNCDVGQEFGLLIHCVEEAHHSAPVCALQRLPLQPSRFVSAGGNNVIVLWEHNEGTLVALAEVDLRKVDLVSVHGLRTVRLCQQDPSTIDIIAVTRGGDVVSSPLVVTSSPKGGDTSQVAPRSTTQSYCVSGLGASTTSCLLHDEERNIIVTCSKDVCVWNASSLALLRKCSLKDTATALCSSHNNAILAVCVGGRSIIGQRPLGDQPFRLDKSGKDSSAVQFIRRPSFDIISATDIEQLPCAAHSITFNHDDSMVAIGCDNGEIYVFEAPASQDGTRAADGECDADDQQSPDPLFVLKPEVDVLSSVVLSVTDLKFCIDGRYLRAEFNGHGTWSGVLLKDTFSAPALRVWDLSVDGGQAVEIPDSVDDQSQEHGMDASGGDEASTHKWTEPTWSDPTFRQHQRLRRRCTQFPRYELGRRRAIDHSDAKLLPCFDGSDVVATACCTVSHTAAPTKADILHASWDAAYVNQVFSSAAHVTSDTDTAAFEDLAAATLEAGNRYSVSTEAFDRLRQQFACTRDPHVHAPVSIQRQSFIQFMKEHVQCVNQQADEMARRQRWNVDIGVTIDDFGRMCVWELPQSSTPILLSEKHSCLGRVAGAIITPVPSRNVPGQAEVAIFAVDCAANVLLKWSVTIQRKEEAVAVQTVTWEQHAEACFLWEQPKAWRKRVHKISEYHNNDSEKPIDQLLALDFKPTPAEKQLSCSSQALPSQLVELSWIYGRSSLGYRGPSVYVDASGDLLYPAGSFIVRADRDCTRQTFRSPQNRLSVQEKITSFTVSPTGRVAAVGYSGKSSVLHHGVRGMASVELFHCQSGSPIAVLPSVCHHSVLLLRFSRDESSRYLIAVGGTPNGAQVLVLYDTLCGHRQQFDIGARDVRDVQAAFPYPSVKSRVRFCAGGEILPYVAVACTQAVFGLHADIQRVGRSAHAQFSLREARYTLGRDPVSVQGSKELFSAVVTVKAASGDSCGKAFAATATPGRPGCLYEFTSVIASTFDPTLQIAGIHTISAVPLTCVSVNRTSTFIVCGDAKGSAWILSSSELRPKQTIDFGTPDISLPISSAQLSDDCSEVIVTLPNGTVAQSSTVIPSPSTIMEPLINIPPAPRQKSGSSSNAADAAVLLCPHPSERELAIIGRKTGQVIVQDTETSTVVASSTLFGRSQLGTCMAATYSRDGNAILVVVRAMLSADESANIESQSSPKSGSSGDAINNANTGSEPKSMMLQLHGGTTTTARASRVPAETLKASLALDSEEKQSSNNTKPQVCSFVAILDAVDLHVQRRVEGPDGLATCVAMSPDSKLLAIGMKDGRIAILATKRNYEIVFICGPEPDTGKPGHSGAVRGLDWDTSSKYFRTNCVAPSYELLFWGQQQAAGNEATSNGDTSSKLAIFSSSAARKGAKSKGKQIKFCQVTMASLLSRRVEWSTASCVLQWSTKGLWPLHDDGTRLQCVSVAVNQQLVVAGDDTGRLVVHRYPVPTQQNGGIAIPGHWCSIGAACFSSDGQSLFSTTSFGETIYHWSVGPAASHDEDDT